MRMEFARLKHEGAEQSCMRVEKYLEFAVMQIDRLLGQGFAVAHPELIGAFMGAAAADYQAHTMIACAEGLDGVAHAIEDIATRGIAYVGNRPPVGAPKPAPYVPLTPPTAPPVGDPLGRWKG